MLAFGFLPFEFLAFGRCCPPFFFVARAFAIGADTLETAFSWWNSGLREAAVSNVVFVFEHFFYSVLRLIYRISVKHVNGKNRDFEGIPCKAVYKCLKQYRL